MNQSRQITLIGLATVAVVGPLTARIAAEEPALKRAELPRVTIRGIYGGVPSQIFERGETLEDYGVNGIWIGSGSVTAELVTSLKAKSKGLKIFAEFNTMHETGYLDHHPDARPIGADGAVAPAPDGWQGVCPTHPGYRRSRMDAFRQTLKAGPIDGIWLDYHHAHASWEQANPILPDTCFCGRCRSRFEKDTGVSLERGSPSDKAAQLLNEQKRLWIRWRCAIFTDWVREFRSILDQERPGALLGSFHCPWTDREHSQAMITKLAIDLKAQSKYLDVLSIMPYHARFGHANDPAWISRQAATLGDLLGIKGDSGDRLRIWPIVQVSDWGEKVRVEQVSEVITHGTRPPATGVIVFAWGTLYPQWDKVEAMRRAYRTLVETAAKDR